jgi:hypothetical protein
MKRDETWASKVRGSLQAMGKGWKFRTDELIEKVGVQSRREKEKTLGALRDFVKRGEVERIDPRLYLYRGSRDEKPTKKKVMWDYMRMRRKSGATVTVEELQQISEASADYVREWIRSVVRLGAVKDLKDGRYQLLQDPTDMPDDGSKAEKLRELRRRQKARVVEALEQIHANVCDICGTMEELVKAVRAFGEES